MIWIILASLVAILVFLFCAPIFPAFQSKGNPNEIIDKVVSDKKQSAGKTVLVAYSTRHGATSSIADKIGDVLNQEGYVADVRPIQKIDAATLEKYDAYVLGSGVIWAKLTPQFIEFLEKHKDAWQKKPTALFAVCLTIQRETEANLKRVRGYIDDSIKHIPELQPFEKIAFAGSVDMRKLTIWERFALKMIFILTPQKGGDHRDMNKVVDWASKVAPGL